VLAPAERNQGPRHPAIMLHHGTKCANMALMILYTLLQYICSC
jgi:hypothetical protein